MKKLLSALLSCSLAFTLLGFSGCCKKSNSQGAQKKCVTKKCVTKKCSKKQKNAKKQPDSRTESIEAYNSDFTDDEALNQFAYLDESQLIEDFDTQLDAANNAVDMLSQDEQRALNAEIDQLVSLWSSDDQDLKDMSVDFKTLYLDAQPDAIETVETKSTLVANAELPEDLEKREPIITALDEAQDIARDIEAETKEIRPEELSA